ncbi:hypothetical protein ACL00Q_00490 [Curtobacterium flaccumfaciens pv. flaccumfaciens]|uniref:hypothetical protein n=1 Tax=Curtobacterium flaccumfaciens TaxID=2035 RepID=UPI0039A148E4
MEHDTAVHAAAFTLATLASMLGQALEHVLVAAASLLAARRSPLAAGRSRQVTLDSVAGSHSRTRISEAPRTKQSDKDQR